MDGDEPQQRGDFIYFDEIEDVLSSTDLLADVIPKLSNAPQYWKWAIIAGHSAVQGAMVCVLHDTAGVSVLDDKSARALLRWYDGQADYPTKQWLAEFLILMERCTDRELMKVTPQQYRDILRLHREFRNTFSHFTPQSWFIRPLGLPQMIGTAIDLIEQSMSRPEVTYRLSEAQTRRFGNNLAKVRSDLALL